MKNVNSCFYTKKFRDFSVTEKILNELVPYYVSDLPKTQNTIKQNPNIDKPINLQRFYKLYSMVFQKLLRH